MKKPRIILIIILSVLCVGAVTLNIPWRVSQQYSALEIDLSNPDYSRELDLWVDGQIYLNIFNKSFFRGNVRIEGYPETFEAFDDGTPTYLRLPPQGAPLTYKLKVGQNFSGTYEYAPSQFKGMVFWKTGAGNAVILVPSFAYSENPDGDWRCIAVGAQTRSDAIRAMLDANADHFPYVE